MSSDMLFEMLETLAKSNKTYEAIISVEFEDNELSSIKLVNNQSFNKETVYALAWEMVRNAVKSKNLSQGIGFGIGVIYNGRKCSLVRTDEKQYFFSFK